MSQVPPLPAVPPQPQERTPRRYSYLRAIVLSPCSKALWRDVGQNWRGVGVLYLLLLLAITWLITTAKIYSDFAHFLDANAPGFVAQIPGITITNGHLSLDRPEPYVIKEPSTGRPVIIIDTTGATTQPPANGMLLTGGALIVQKSAGETRTYDLSKVQSFHLDRQQINQWVSVVRVLFFPVMLAVVLIASLIWRLLLLLLGGAVGQVFASSFQAPLSYAATMRLSAIAMTPGILLNTLLEVLDMRGLGCFGFFLGIALYLLFMALAVKANAPDRQASGFPVMPPAPRGEL